MEKSTVRRSQTTEDFNGQIRVFPNPTEVNWFIKFDNNVVPVKANGTATSTK